MTDDLRFSRTKATATSLGADAHRFTAKRVLLTGVEEVLVTPNGWEMAIAAVLLLMRTTASLVVALPRSQSLLAEELTAWAVDHAWDSVPSFVDLPIDLTRFDAILSIGGKPRPDLPWTVITCDGWSVRVSSGASPVAQSCRDANPVAAVGAASLGVGEVFKRLLPLRKCRGEMLDGCAFSLWNYCEGVHSSGPSLTEALELDVLVAGAGAIGNGVAHLLSRLNVRGGAVIVDAQRYGEENWGTCLRATRRSVTELKADHVARLLGGRLRVARFTDRIEAVAALADWRTPPIVLSGFDNVDARYAVQDLWPDVIIDGAIGPKLECQVSVHPWASDVACLRCLFDRPIGPSAEAVQSEASGLGREALGDLTRALTEADIASAASPRQGWLRTRLGMPICSVLVEAQSLSSDGLSPTFRPSVPFVATFSACMMVTELVRYVTNGSTVLEPRFFFSLLWGPPRGDFYPEDRRSECICVRRAKNIETFRAMTR